MRYIPNYNLTPPEILTLKLTYGLAQLNLLPQNPYCELLLLILNRNLIA